MRPTILIKLSDELIIPFYRSSWLWRKYWVQTGKFYPIFWVYKDRFNKWRESEINNYYWSPLLAALAKEIDDQYSDVNNFWNLNDRNFSDDDFVKAMNVWKNPSERTDETGTYENINKTLDKIIDFEKNIKI